MNSLQPRFRIHYREPRRLLRAAANCAIFLLVACSLILHASAQAKRQSSGEKPVPAAIQRVKILLEKGTPALEIVTTEPVSPQITKLENGMRVTIDLPNTSMSVSEKTVPIKNRDLGALRLKLRDTVPPMVHIEVDFRSPLAYTWDSAGNRLLVSFHEIPKENASAAATTPASATSTVVPPPLPVSASAEVADFTHIVPAELLAPGASVSAVDDTVVLRVKHAGDVYVCPQTSVSVVHSRNGPDVMLALNSGGLETHLTLQNSADEVVTPDFRILLRGPGDFHYAIREDLHGNACIRTLPGNTASAVIYELMGNGKYDAKSGDQLVFHDGKLSPETSNSESSNSSNVLPVECGCPPPARPALLASVKPEPKFTVENSSPDRTTPGAGREDADPTLEKKPADAGTLAPADTGMQMPQLAEALRQQPHAQVEASLAFTPNPAEIAARHMPADSRQVSSPFTALPPSSPSANAPEKHKTVFGKIKSLFSHAFQ